MGFEDARMAARQRLKGILRSLAFCAWRRADVTMAAKEKNEIKDWLFLMK